MNRKEIFEKNLALSTEFNKYLNKHVALLKRIPENAHLLFLPENDSELSELNRRLGLKLKNQGETVVFVKTRFISAVKAPKIVSAKISVAA